MAVMLRQPVNQDPDVRMDEPYEPMVDVNNAEDALTAPGGAGPAAAGPTDAGAVRQTSYAVALKSTAIMGGSTAVMMVIRAVRSKALAMWLGPTGFGLEANFNAIIDLARTISGLGVNSSGVRQIAEAVSTGDEDKIAATVTTLRRVCLVLGLAGAAGLFLLRGPISRFTFGDTTHAWDVGLISLMLVFTAINGGQGALIQGMRRIGDVAKMGIWGTLLATAVTLPIVYVYGLRGVSSYVVLSGAMLLLVSWLFARRVRVKSGHVPWSRIKVEAAGLIQLGVVLSFTGLATTGVEYLRRVMITREEGLAGSGQYQAATQLAIYYVGFILQAMGTDFYPRLTASARDHAECNRIVNEQAEISLLLALPGILGTLFFAPLVVQLFYSKRFDVAVVILCWQMAGILLRVASWPLGMVAVAVGRAGVSLFTELFASVVSLGFTWLGMKFYGLPGLGVSFFVGYTFYAVVVSLVVRRLTGFKWSPINARLIGAGAVLVAVALACHFLLPIYVGLAIGAVLTSAVGFYCLKVLAGLIGVEKMEQKLKRFGIRLPLTKWLGPREKNSTHDS